MELPRLQPLYETYKDQGFNVVVVDGKRQTDLAKKFIEKHGLTYTALENGEDDAEVAMNTFLVSGYPTSFLIDREGRVMYSHLGFEAGDIGRDRPSVVQLSLEFLAPNDEFVLLGLSPSSAALLGLDLHSILALEHKGFSRRPSASIVGTGNEC